MFFVAADAYAPAVRPGACTAAFAGFWWSYVPHQRQQEFLRNLHGGLTVGARVVLLDNRYVEGSSTPLGRRDDAGNTYQRRGLADGSENEVLKNFPTAQELRAAFEPVALDLQLVTHDYYWGASGRRPRASPPRSRTLTGCGTPGPGPGRSPPGAWAWCSGAGGPPRCARDHR